MSALLVGLDGHMVGRHETGNETYVKGLVEGFRETNGLDLIVYHAGAPWAEPDDNIRFERLSTANPFARLGVELPFRSAREHLSLLHVTYAAPLWSAAPIVVTVHDICFATNPEWFSRRDLIVLSSTVPRALRQAAHVITVSQDARARIIERYSVPASKISAVHNGPGAAAEPIGDEEARAELAALGLDLQRPYVLTVGNVQPRKNLVRLMTALSGLTGRSGQDVELVVVGPRRFQSDEIMKSAARLSGRIHFTGYVTDRQLAACYHSCALFVLPSLYEGFGVPVIEAMAHGVPVACSNTGALPEVAGDAAVLFDPRDVDAIADSMHRLLGDKDLRRDLAARARTRAARFSWRRSAEQTLSVYQRAAG